MGWCSGDYSAPVDRAPSDARAFVPVDLLTDCRVGVQARVLYGVLQLTPEFRNPTGQFSYAHLSSLTHASLTTVRLAVGELVQTAWLRATQLNHRAPIHFSLQNPVTARIEADVTRARQRLEEAPFLGEALMREYLSLLADSDDFEDNAAPGFLVNPFTDERMELDRFYPPGVAFEFNGPQHYGPTDRFSGADAARQRGRDYIKLGICVTRGISLLVIHPEDLTMKAMRQKIGDLLPVRDLHGRQPLIDFLESVSRRYRLAARRGRRPASADNSV